jgi:hypothetical protein
VAENSLPLSIANDGGACALKRCRRTRNIQHLVKFRPDNIKEHHLEQHPKNWAAYLKLLAKETSGTEARKLLFDQSRLEAFYASRVAVEGKTKVFSLDKYTVDVVVREMLFNPNDDEERLAGDRQWKWANRCSRNTKMAPRPLFEEHQDGSKTVVRYNCIGSAASDFEYAVTLFAVGPSFN